MNKYKVEFVETRTYIINVLAENEEQAKKFADDKYNNGMYTNYDLTDEDVKIGTIYDVTHTDDPFNL